MKCKSRCGLFVVWAIVGVGIASAVVMALWNALTPAIFGWKEISYLQAMGMLVLSRILFGAWGRCGHGRCGKGSCSTADLEKMTPEEREQFETKVKSKWCCK